MTIEALLTEQNQLIRELIAELKVTPKTPALVKEVKKVEEAAPVGLEVTYDDAKLAVTTVVKTKGRDAGLAILASFNTDSLLKVAPTEWAAVIAACTEAIAK